MAWNEEEIRKYSPKAWTEEEIRQYHPRDYAPLRRSYQLLELDYSQPGKIAAYLFKKVNPSADLCGLLLKISEKMGRAATLNLLEDMAIADYERSKSSLRAYRKRRIQSN